MSRHTRSRTPSPRYSDDDDDDQFAPPANNIISTTSSHAAGGTDDVTMSAHPAHKQQDPTHSVNANADSLPQEEDDLRSAIRARPSHARRHRSRSRSPDRHPTGRGHKRYHRRDDRFPDTPGQFLPPSSNTHHADHRRSSAPRIDPLTLDVLLSFRQFCDTLPPQTREEDLLPRYDTYKEAFQAKLARRFVTAHKSEDWFLERYHPDRIARRLDDKAQLIRSQLFPQFQQLLHQGLLDHLTLEQQTEGGHNEKDSAISNPIEPDAVMEDMEEEGALPSDDTLDHPPSDRLSSSLSVPRQPFRRFQTLFSQIPLTDAQRAVAQRPSTLATLFIKAVPVTVSRAALLALFERVAPNTLQHLSLGDVNPARRFHRFAWATLQPHVDVHQTLALLDHQKIGDFELHFLVDKVREPQVRLSDAFFSSAVQLQRDAVRALQLVTALDRVRGVSFPWDASAQGGVSLRMQVDRLVLYLRRVHCVCYYCGYAHDSDEEMQRKCGLLHVRESAETPKSPALFDPIYVRNWQNRLDFILYQEGGVESSLPVGSENSETAKNTYIETQVVKVEEEKYKCALCAKMFRGADFVRKHVVLKHEAEIAVVVEEVTLFNLFLRDPYRVSFNDVMAATAMTSSLPNMVNHRRGPPMMMPQAAAPSGMMMGGSGGVFGQPPPRFPAYFQQPRRGLMQAGFGAPFVSPAMDPRALRTYVDLDAPAQGGIE